MQQRPNEQVLQWLDSLDERSTFVSVLSLGEIRYGVGLLATGAKRSKLEAWVDGDLQVRFAGRVLPITNRIADRWGAMAARLQLAGRHLPPVDTLLAATAEEHNLTLATRNDKDFASTGVLVVNPWD